jgi:glycosyltransferase involved in cell wall biosynthesis
MPTPTRISLITPSYQQAAYLEECLRSVQEQGWPACEHIVVDGGSSDGSREIIEAHAARFTWWCSEKDNGQSDAINKGLAHAQGDVFSWINSDDALLPGALARVGDTFAADPRLLVFGGRVTHRKAQGEHVFDRLNDASDTRRLFADPIINQPATYYRMSVVKSIGGVDPGLRYVMDVELWWQVLFRHGTEHLRFEPVELAMFRLHDESKTVSQHAGFLNELADVLHGLCTRTGNTDLAGVLATGHPQRRPLRGIPASPAEHAGIVRVMAIHFLLKWHGHIHNEVDFRMMKQLHQGAQVKEADLLPEMRDRWHKASRSVAGTSWNMYRAKRKLHNLFR